MSRRLERGAALLVSVIVVLVVTVLAVGAIRFASRQVGSSIAAKKEVALTACADAARAMLMSRWKLLGQKTAEQLPALNEQLEDIGPTVLRGGHYGDVNVDSVQIVKLDKLTTGALQGARGLDNTVPDEPDNFRVVVHCTQGREPNARELEVEFGVNYGL